MAQGADQVGAADLVGGAAVDGVHTVRDHHEGEQEHADEVGGVGAGARFLGRGGGVGRGRVLGRAGLTVGGARRARCVHQRKDLPG